MRATCLVTQVALAACVLLIGCDEVRRERIGDYMLISHHPKFNALYSSSNREVVPGNIERIGTIEKWIYGYLNPDPYVEFHFTNPPQGGYFILDMETGEVSFGYSEEAFKDAMASRGVSRPSFRNL